MRDITDVDDPVDGSGQRYRAVIIFWQGYCFLLWSFSFCTLIISRLFIISLHQHNNKFLRFYLYLLIIIEIHDCLIISLLYTWQFFCALTSTPPPPIPPLHLLLSRFILRKIAIFGDDYWQIVDPPPHFWFTLYRLLNGKSTNIFGLYLNFCLSLKKFVFFSHSEI